MATEDGQQQGAAPDITGSGTTFELPPDPPAADEGEAGEPAEGAPAKPANRQQRRAERGESFAAATRAAEERARRAEEAAQRTAVELAELRGRVTAGESQRQQGAPDPDEAALIAAQKKISAAVARMGAGDATAEADWHAAMRDHARIVARQVAREEGAEVEKRISGKIPAPVDPGQAALAAEFPFLATNEHFRSVANGIVSQLVALEHRDMKNPEVRLATLREGAARAAAVLKLGGGSRKPTDMDRDRISGTSGRDTGAGNGPVRVHLNDEQKAMARQSFRSLPEADAYQKWWKEIGSKIQTK